MFHQRTVKTSVLVLLLPLMAVGGLVGFLAGLVTGVVAWMLIEKFMPKPDWYDHARREGRLHASGPQITRSSAAETNQR